MMQGRGVTNYAGDKPSHALTTKMTEFDDALVNRGIVTTEQVMLAKGASPEEAVRLSREKQQENRPLSRRDATTSRTSSTSSTSSQRPPTGKDDIVDDEDADDSDSFQDDIDDDFFARYRQERMAQLDTSTGTKSTSTSTSTTEFVERISRSDWSTKVNEASKHRWVLIILVDSSTREQEILQELHILTKKYSSQFSLLTIEATDAVPNWPTQRIPAMFAYRDGVKQKEWITDRPGEFPMQQHLERMFKLWGVLGETK
jgi:hypothetical protein